MIHTCTFAKVGTKSWNSTFTRHQLKKNDTVLKTQWSHDLLKLRQQWNDYNTYPYLLVISGMRNFIDRNISYFFQFLDLKDGPESIKTRKNNYKGDSVLYSGTHDELKKLSIKELQLKFWSLLDDFHYTPLQWLDEFFEITNIDIKKELFNKDQGYKLYECGPGRQVLLYTFERLPEINNDMLKKCLGISTGLRHINKSEYKWYNDIRPEFCKSLQYSKQYVNDMLFENKWMSYFYTNYEIQNFHKNIQQFVEKSKPKTIMPDTLFRCPPYKLSEKYITLCDDIDVIKWKQLLNTLPESVWSQNCMRQTKFHVHRQTQSLVLIWSKSESDFNYNPIQYPLFNTFKDLLQIVQDIIISYYGYSVHVWHKCMLAKMPPNTYIDPHIDHGKYLRNVHRIHLPIETTNDVDFMIDHEVFHFRSGQLIEIDNTRLHSVRNNNNQNSRIHLIIDYFYE